MSRANKSRAFGRTAGTALAIAAMALAIGCSKKKPPPPPPPPPPPEAPPPPEPVKFETISQEMKADPRVQFAGRLEVTDEGVARAVVTLADAIARGDASKLDPILSLPAKNVVEALRSSGDWDRGTKDIEAVRVVYASPNAGSAVLEQVGSMLSGNVPTEVLAQIAKAVSDAATASGAAPIDPSNLATPEKVKEQWDKILSDPTMEESIRQQMKGALGSLPGLAEGPEGQFLVITAVQDSSGAYLLGWGAAQAFGSWVFTNLATVQDEKRRVADFDSIGAAGFLTSAGTPMASAAPSTRPEDAPPPPEAKPAEQQKPPTRKSTPNGPVTIPQPPPG